MEDQTSPINFGEWLKHRRKALDMTQAELSSRVGCSIGALRKIESGDRRPSKQLAGLLAKALEISDEDLQTFIRVARGELYLERLRVHPDQSSLDLPDIASLWKTQALESPERKVTPSSQSIPSQTTLLIGRENEIAALDRIFRDPECRLLTLTGIGGIGKTRLAIEFATRNHARYPGGVFFIPLTPVNSPEKIVPAIADVFEFRFSGPLDPKEQLLNYISSHIKQETLLVLDNLEHLLLESNTEEAKFGAAELVSEMLQRLPNIKILGTSRERLNLHGEWTYELHGLSVPPLDFVGQLDEFDSIALFVKSAQRIKPDFRVAHEDEYSLVHISQLLDGVPLAIELGAAWVGMLSCQEIAQEIQTNLDFLTTTMRDIPARHRSMRATFDHSWGLLSKQEQSVLSKLSVFHGGFDRDAAYQIAGATLPILASLSAKSLLRRAENGRYDLHEVIRQYSLTHLQEYPGSVKTYENHCEHYLKMVQIHERSLKNAAQQEAIQQLTSEIDNIRAAWAWAVQNECFDRLEYSGRGFGWYFEITGLYREGIEQLELVIQALKHDRQDLQKPRLLGLMFIQQALLYFRIGEFDRAQILYQESIKILRPIGDQALLADALIFGGIILHLSGEYARAKLLIEEGLAIARESHEQWFEAYAICNLGYISSIMGHYEEGYEQMLAALSIFRGLGDPHYIALVMNFMVPTLIKLGKCGEAKAFMQESIALCEQSKNRWGLGTAYCYMGSAFTAEGEFKQAKTYLLQSLEIFGDFTKGWSVARSLIYLGDAALGSGDLKSARKNYQEALRLSVEERAIPLALDTLLGLAELNARDGKEGDALVLCHTIINHPYSEDQTCARAKDLLASLEAHLDLKEIDAIFDAAMDKTLDTIIKETMSAA